MSILVLGCWGEDIDFQGPGGVTPNVQTTVSSGTYSECFRSAYARCALFNGTTGNMIKSNPMPGGPVTSCWLSFQGSIASESILLGNSNVQLSVGLGQSGTNSGLFIGTSFSKSGQYAICIYDGSNTTQLATEVGTSENGGLHRFDLELVNYGPSSTVNLYVDGILMIGYSGSTSISGVTGFDAVFIAGHSNGGLGQPLAWMASEVIVANGDTRSFPGLVSLYLTGQGTTNEWNNNVYSNINGVSLSESNPAYVDVSNQDQQYQTSSFPSGSFSVAARKITVMAAASSDSTPTHLTLGYNNGIVGFGSSPGSQLLTTGYQPYEELDLVNPITGNPFTQAEVSALQLNIRSLA